MRFAPAREELDCVSSEFPESAAVTGLAQVMVGVDEVWDRLQQVRAAGWKAPPFKANRGTLYKYIKNVKTASEGCVTDE